MGREDDCIVVRTESIATAIQFLVSKAFGVRSQSLRRNAPIVLESVDHLLEERILG